MNGTHFLDSFRARGLAVAVALLAASALGWINRAALLPSEQATAGAGNPELAACLTERVGAVETMRAEAILNDAQYKAFKTRATDYCRAQFPGE
ncbi:hypothetical protein [Breoghania sp. L-A4]|uniref:hypothetical protein n=1 Tax=Breoghania sp. L-A4 TaxID=2304600 RepID=UPI000E35FD67|nr:hypothetical protein [Breoghania sp. L-A4]AXS40157.1 hypothetical protein D1F64_08885 [Breoghania sp. L-A4]